MRLPLILKLASKNLRVLDDIEHIQHHHKSAHRDAEAEAYALEHNPRFVYGLLKICLEHSDETVGPIDYSCKSILTPTRTDRSRGRSFLLFTSYQ